MSNIGIIGSRRRDLIYDYQLVKEAFFKIYEGGDWIVSGGCPQGGDRFAEIIARQKGIPILIFYPAWNVFGKQAGFLRNSDIALNSDKALIACVAEDRRGGTEDTISKYKKVHPNGVLILV